MANIALFLGAGASVEFGKPTTFELKQKLKLKYQTIDLHDQLIQSLLDVENFYDIEYVLSAIEQIHDFAKTYGNEFLLNMTGKRTQHQMFSLNNYGIPYKKTLEELEKVRQTIRNEIFDNYSWDSNFNDKLERIYDGILGMIKKYSKDIWVFTTNYDLAMEVYCSNPNKMLRCIDGFRSDFASKMFLWAKGDFGYMGANPSGQDVFLHKLHGSLDWKYHKDRGLVRTGEESISDDPNIEYNMLVYPTLSPKDGYDKEPYVTILKKFDEFIQNADACIVIGYSFRDNHVNDVFKKFIDQKKPFFIISPSASSNFLVNLYDEKFTEIDNDKISARIRAYPSVYAFDNYLNEQNAIGIAMHVENKLKEHGIKL